MTYWNPIEKYGVDAFARDFAAAGGAGIVTPDLIPDEAEEWFAASDAHRLDRIFLVAPSSTPTRLEMTADGLPWLRLRDERHGRDRRPRADVRRGAGPGLPGTGGQRHSGGDRPRRA